MELGNISIGVAQPSMNEGTYTGKHRDNNMFYGVGLIPLGDRNRAIHEYGIDVLEERDSVDKYSKYHC